MRQSLSACALLACLAAVAAAQTAPNAPTVFNVLDYGAKRDGSASSTAAFRAAIQACAKAGGGTVFVPAGQYISGAIELVSNLTFFVDSGAVIRFAANREEYPMVQGRFEGTEMRTPAAMIGGSHLENVTITGHGTLVADNAAWRQLVAAPAYRTALNEVLALLERKQPVPDDKWKSVGDGSAARLHTPHRKQERAHRGHPHFELAHVGAAHFVLRKRGY